MSDQDQIQQTILPIPDQPHVGLTTYDTRDPDSIPVKSFRLEEWKKDRRGSGIENSNSTQNPV